MSGPDGREAYLGLADELSGDPRFLSIADPEYIWAAREWAATHHANWPPCPDVDNALLHVRTMEDLHGRCNRCGDMFMIADADQMVGRRLLDERAEVMEDDHVIIVHVGCLRGGDKKVRG